MTTAFGSLSSRAQRGICSYIALALLAAGTLGAQEGRLERDVFTWSGRIPENRWIMIRNLNGPVHVVPGTDDRVEVTGTRRTRRGDPEYVRFEVQRFGPGNQDVLVCALWGENSTCNEDGYRTRNNDNRNRNNDVSVEFRVRVPKGVKVASYGVNGDVRVDGVENEVDASSVNGAVFVDSRSGPVNASTVNGSVRASMGRFDLQSDLRFSSVNGTVTVEFSDDINAEVDLSTVNGRFVTDFPVTITGRIDPRRLRATLGKGGPRIRMSTVNGNVELRRR
ncbi:MAG TPA: DUF4097 family beta strand repeat-containing protein [Gemmatimonadaceae bacterium]|nr:DUF4097 family beta strand repeat-containing protein [Gemmatimonadaceae bacterium]